MTRYVVRIRYGDDRTMTREYAARWPAMFEFHVGEAESVHPIPDYDGGDGGGRARAATGERVSPPDTPRGVSYGLSSVRSDSEPSGDNPAYDDPPSPSYGGGK